MLHPQRQAGAQASGSPISSSRSRANTRLPPCDARSRTSAPTGAPMCRYPQYPRDAARRARATTCSISGRCPQDDTDAVIVPEGTLFLMGDNRDNSLDSRFPAAGGGIGLVPLENLVGRAQRHVLLDRRHRPNGSSRGPGSPPRAGTGSGTAFERRAGATRAWLESARPRPADEALWSSGADPRQHRRAAQLRAARVPRRPGARAVDRRMAVRAVPDEAEGKLSQRLNALVSRDDLRRRRARDRRARRTSGSASRRATTARATATTCSAT